MSAEFDDVFVTPEDITAANEASSFLFQIPVDAARKGRPEEPDGGKASWKQEFVIVGLKAENGELEDKKNSVTYPCLTIEVDFQVPPDAQRVLTSGEVVPDPNAGRSLKQWYRLVNAARGDKNHPKYKAYYFNLGRLKGIIMAAGFEVPADGFSLKAYFGTDVLVNQRLTALVDRTWFEGRAKDEVSSFLKPVTN